MSGYREHGYDPNAYQHPGRPARPFNWVQWTGFAFALIGAALSLYYLAAVAGWVPQILDNVMPATTLVLIGVVLVNSRREPPTLEGSEQLERNRRVLFITLAVVGFVLGVATVIAAFTGA
jgi:hypothetical protein